MKNIKNLILIAILTLSIISCKKEEKIEEVNKHNTERKEIKPENLAEATFSIEGMTCEMGCAKTIENKLSQAKGVANANVSFKENLANVSFDKSVTNTEDLKSIIEQTAGGDVYKVTAIK